MERHQLLPGEPDGGGPPHVHPQHHPLLHLHAGQSLDLRVAVLQDQQLHVLHDGLTQRVHAPGHQRGQAEGEEEKRHRNFSI